MKWPIILIIIVFAFQGYSQSAKKKVFMAKVQQTDGSFIKGILYRVYDSSIEIARREKNTPDTIFQTVAVRDIKTIKVRKKDSMGISIGVGILVGSIIGYATYNDPCGPETMFCLDFGPAYPAGIGAAIGGTVGAIVGLSMVKIFKVNYDQTKFSNQVVALKQYALRKH